jgi:copper chaperone CopZ
VRVALVNLPGIESADVSLDKASTDIRLKADNRITMSQLRDVLKNNGYPTRDAHVEARGRIVERSGKLVLDLLNGSTMNVEGQGVALKASDQIVQISGVSRAEGKSGERFTIQSVK